MAGVVQSVDRALNILELLSDYDDGLGITEIGSMIGLHKSTVHRLLGTLMYKGFVIKDNKTNNYRLSLKMYELGSKKIESTNILKASKQYTKRLMKAVNEVVHLVIRDGTDIVYIDKVEADNTISMASKIGRRSPLYCTSVGKAIMSQLTEEEVEDIWSNSNIERLTKNTITDIKLFKEELELIKERGYAVDNEENELGVRCIGVPIFNRKSEIEGAISVSGPITRITENKVEDIAFQINKNAQLISKELGYNK